MFVTGIAYWEASLLRNSAKLDLTQTPLSGLISVILKSASKASLPRQPLWREPDGWWYLELGCEPSGYWLKEDKRISLIPVAPHLFP